MRASDWLRALAFTHHRTGTRLRCAAHVMPLINDRYGKDVQPFRDLTLPYSYFSEPDRVLILHVAKAGGTSLLWKIFAARGFDPDEVARGTAHPEVSWDQALWSRTNLVLLNSVTEEVRYG